MSGTTTPIRKLEPLSSVIDRFGEESRREAELKAELKVVTARRSELEDQIGAHYLNHPAEAGDVAHGELYLVEVSPKEFERKIIDKAKLFKLARLSMADFLELACTITLAWVDKAIPEKKHHLFLTKEQTGSRRYKAVRKSDPIPSRAA